MTSVIGVDVGGTKVTAARVDVERISVGEQVTAATDSTRPSDEVLADCARLTSAVADETTLGVALGICELVSSEGEIGSRQTVDWIGHDLAEAFAPLRLLAVESDVRAAALAEARLTSVGALPSFLFVVVGTGLSSAWVVEGVPWSGTHGHAILLGGTDLESRASGGGLQRRLSVDDLSAVRDLAVHPVVCDGARRLGHELATLVNVLDPAAVVVGGGLGLNPEYRALVEAAMREQIVSEFARCVPVLPAALGGAGGALGAALVGIERLGRGAA